MANKMRPYSIETKREEKIALTETDIFHWKELLMANVRSEPDWEEFTGPGLTWEPKEGVKVLDTKRRLES